MLTQALQRSPVQHSLGLTTGGALMALAALGWGGAPKPWKVSEVVISCLMGIRLLPTAPLGPSLGAPHETK